MPIDMGGRKRQRGQELSNFSDRTKVLIGVTQSWFERRPINGGVRMELANDSARLRLVWATNCSKSFSAEFQKKLKTTLA
ncbi:hypothetical protein Syncc9902_1954 [Synechococcus sp. CC9902]|nr:hypothetical protein Syncc9902_1954 [Synechococcus sp. CC9902]